MRYSNPEYVVQIVDMYLDGKEQKEIVKATGLDYFTVRYWLKKKGVYDETRFKRHGNTDALRERSAQIKATKEFNLASDLESAGFDYLYGYDGAGSVITIRHRDWGCYGEFTRYVDSNFKKQILLKTLECPCCIKREKERQEQEKREKELSKQRDIETRKHRQELKTQTRLNEKHICKECGSEFTLDEYAKRESLDVRFMSKTVYCSTKCRKAHESRSRRKYNLTHGKHSKRCIKYGVEFDKTVNLEGLISKVGTRCALCGGFCDKNDYKVVNGVYLFGDNYPSIDHIIPLSKGVKGHTWDNVQVAHRGCNSRKGAKLEEKAKAV